ncbi:MAG TPA: hypothetical protein PLQ36_03855, partial [Candidatus Gracilibacteria bacterium]|nr:hypothetical protein [Candidatus Gracilibacteria bacterium]
MIRFNCPFVYNARIQVRAIDVVGNEAEDVKEVVMEELNYCRNGECGIDPRGGVIRTLSSFYHQSEKMMKGVWESETMGSIFLDPSFCQKNELCSKFFTEDANSPLHAPIPADCASILKITPTKAADCLKTIKNDDGKLVGFAWSNQIGWVKVDTLALAKIGDSSLYRLHGNVPNLLVGKSYFGNEVKNNLNNWINSGTEIARQFLHNVQNNIYRQMAALDDRFAFAYIEVKPSDWTNTQVTAQVSLESNQALNDIGIAYRCRLTDDFTNLTVKESNFSFNCNNEALNRYGQHLQVQLLYGEGENQREFVYDRPYYIDRTKPVLGTIPVYPNVWQNTPLTVDSTGNSSDTLAGIRGFQYKCKESAQFTTCDEKHNCEGLTQEEILEGKIHFVCQEEGEHQASVQAIDRAGNTSEIRSIPYKYDQTADTWTINKDPSIATTYTENYNYGQENIQPNLFYKTD